MGPPTDWVVTDATPWVTPADAPAVMWVTTAPRKPTPSQVAKAQARKPCAVSRKSTSCVWTPTHFVRSRPAINPPMVDESIATTMTKRPAPRLKVAADTPEAAHGDTTEKPTPAPKASKTSVSAAVVTLPAITAPQLTAECLPSSIKPGFVVV